MNYLHQRCEILGGAGGMLPPENFENLGLLECISCNFLLSGARIRVFEQKRKHKSPLKLLRM